MGKKSSSNKPSKANQASRTSNNKAKHRKEMEEQYIKAHGNIDNMPDFTAKPDYTPRKERIVTEMLKRGKVPKKFRG